MSEIQPVSAVTTPIQNVTGGSNQNDQLAKVIENNNSTAKTCSYVALGTSIATLLPLSILAIKTGKISKVAGNLEEGAKGVINNIKEATAIPEDVSKSVRGILDKLGNLVNSEEAKGILKKINEKMSEVDSKEIFGSISETITSQLSQVGEILSSKAESVDVETVNKLLATLDKKLSDINLPEFKASLGEFFSGLISKIKGSGEIPHLDIVPVENFVSK